MSALPSCEDCQFFCPDAGMSALTGECRRYAPMIQLPLAPDQPSDPGSLLARFPETLPDCWCGDFKARPPA